MPSPPDDDLQVIVKALTAYARTLARDADPRARQTLLQVNTLTTRLTVPDVGRLAILPIPEPTDVDSEGVAYWGDIHGGGFVSAMGSRPEDSLVDLSGVSMGHAFHLTAMSPERSRQVAGWLIAGSIHVINTGADRAAQ